MNGLIIEILLFTATALFLGWVLGTRRTELRRYWRRSGSHATARSYLGDASVNPIDIIHALDEFAIVSKTDRHGRINYVNKKFVEISGYQKEELLGCDHRIINSGFHPKTFFGEMWKTIRSGRTWWGNIRNRAKDGHFYWVRTMITPLSDRLGRPREFLSLRFDITEIVQAQQRQLSLLEKVNNANRQLRDFGYAVSHDMRHPLRTVRSSLDWLAASYAKDLDEEGRECMGLIRDRLTRMERIIGDLLDLSTIGMREEFISLVDLNTVVKDVIDLLSPPANFRISQRGPLPILKTEKTYIRQIFQNLIGNAVKYMDKPDGEIVISHQVANGDYVFTVKDNGPGIPGDHRETIFEIFQTLQPRDKTQSGGIGLTLVKKMVERLGGRVWVDSQEGVGSIFYFTHPIKAPAGVFSNEPKTVQKEGTYVHDS